MSNRHPLVIICWFSLIYSLASHVSMVIFATMLTILFNLLLHNWLGTKNIVFQGNTTYLVPVNWQYHFLANVSIWLHPVHFTSRLSKLFAFIQNQGKKWSPCEYRLFSFPMIQRKKLVDLICTQSFLPCTESGCIAGYSKRWLLPACDLMSHRYDAQ